LGPKCPVSLLYTLVKPVQMTNGKPLIPTDGAPDATAARAYSICTSLPDGLKTNLIVTIVES